MTNIRTNAKTAATGATSRKKSHPSHPSTKRSQSDIQDNRGAQARATGDDFMQARRGSGRRRVRLIIAC